MEHNQIIILKQNDYFRTSGCKSFLSFELQVVAKGIDELSFRVLINYLITLSKKHKISNNQTIAYYSWILKFIELENAVFEVFELNPQTKNYIKGIFFFQ